MDVKITDLQFYSSGICKFANQYSSLNKAWRFFEAYFADNGEQICLAIFSRLESVQRCSTHSGAKSFAVSIAKRYLDTLMK